jgi:hypothetical protein
VSGTAQRTGIVGLANPVHTDPSDGEYSVALIESPPGSGEYTVIATFERTTLERLLGVHSCEFSIEEDPTGQGVAWEPRLDGSAEARHNVAGSSPASWHRQSGDHVLCQSRVRSANPAATYFVDLQVATDGGFGSLRNVALSPATPVVGPTPLGGGMLVLEWGASQLMAPTVTVRHDFFGQGLESTASCAMNVTVNSGTGASVLDGFTAIQPARCSGSAYQCAMVDEHNAVRTNPAPTPVPRLAPLSWSTSLEQLAATWAATCTFGHNPSPDVRGENVAAALNLSTTPATIVASWSSEASNYDFASNSCISSDPCLHYTQLVQRAATHVGCASQICATGSPFGTGAPWLLTVCDYDYGNFVGQRPYLTSW